MLLFFFDVQSLGLVLVFKTQMSWSGLDLDTHVLVSISSLLTSTLVPTHFNSSKPSAHKSKFVDLMPNTICFFLICLFFGKWLLTISYHFLGRRWVCGWCLVNTVCESQRWSPTRMGCPHPLAGKRPATERWQYLQSIYLSPARKHRWKQTLLPLK